MKTDLVEEVERKVMMGIDITENAERRYNWRFMPL